MKLVGFLFLFVSIAQFTLGAAGVIDPMDIFENLDLLDHLAIGSLHSSLGLAGAVFFSVAVLVRLQSRRGR
ncbi:hypothetical protein VDG1235_4071 [Verrucomicrobiia bacterium DG1235]|nr:hypothetical protein VDG1235_4071 [Verrucomicrobiae bacterium DG1235]